MKVIGFPGIVLSRDGIGKDVILPPCVNPQDKSFTDSGYGNQCFRTCLSIKYSISPLECACRPFLGI